MILTELGRALAAGLPGTRRGAGGSRAAAPYQIRPLHMKLSAVPLLTTTTETNDWYRVIGTRFLPSAINTAHTRTTPSRFYDPSTAAPQFRTLYLSDDPLVAQFEAQVLLGSPATLRSIVPAPRRGWIVLRARVSLAAVLDLSDPGSQGTLDMSVQELTGDWQGYRWRSPATNVTGPTGTAPTQALGEAIHH